ncbi:MAG: ABC transporter permease, partial [Oscillospiraceae bacterium]
MNIINGILVSLPGAASQGIMWGIMTLGVYLTYRILDFADLTVDGSFATGGAISAVLIVNGVNPFLSLFIAFLGGTLAGFSTGILNTVFKIPPILSGILTMLALYS